jgi:hypothetical protein
MCEYNPNIEFVDKELTKSICDICGKFVRSPIITSCGHLCGKNCFISNKFKNNNICKFCGRTDCVINKCEEVNQQIKCANVVCNYPFCELSMKYCEITGHIEKCHKQYSDQLLSVLFEQINVLTTSLTKLTYDYHLELFDNLHYFAFQDIVFLPCRSIMDKSDQCIWCEKCQLYVNGTCMMHGCSSKRPTPTTICYNTRADIQLLANSCQTLHKQNTLSVLLFILDRKKKPLRYDFSDLKDLFKLEDATANNYMQFNKRALYCDKCIQNEPNEKIKNKMIEHNKPKSIYAEAFESIKGIEIYIEKTKNLNCYVPDFWNTLIEDIIMNIKMYELDPNNEIELIRLLPSLICVY